MRLNEKFKIDVLEASQVRQPTTLFSGRFEDVPWTFLQNCKNKQQITYATMCIVLFSKVKKSR